MHQYEVTVFAVAESGEETRIGTATIMARSPRDAERAAMNEVWDERLNTASCRARYTVRPL